MRPWIAAVALGALALAGAAPVRAQTAPPPPDPPPTGAPPASQAPAPPVNLDRIRKGLDQAPTIKLDEPGLRFYLEIYARQLKVEDLIGNFDLRNGPVPGAPMTHQEFVRLVTPKELNSSAGITAFETLQFALTNYLAQLLIRRGIQEMREARTEREVEAIRERIARELAALRGGGK